MKIMKKTLALSLVFLFTLVSCKKTESSSSVDSSSPTTSSVISSSVSYASDVDKTPTLSPSTVSFDKYSPNDVHFSLNTFNEAITSVKEGQTTITYTYEGGTLTLGQSLFIDKDLGTYTITVTTSQGVATATVTVIDTTPSTVWTRPDYDVSYFNNKDFHAYGGNLGTIPGQWNGYGIGDPFVMRFNGTYYLYASTLDSENGIRAWHSADLINWSKVQAEGLPEGYVVSLDDYTSRAAYAPEVYYYNGTFYLYTSPGGSGHYVYTATAPEGPFIRATDNFGLSIDGSVLIDDDEQMYFTRANSGDIRIHRMDDMLSVRSASLALDNTNLGGWTEGSYILKRDGYYYLTYTGNHVASDGYRVSYSYSQANNIYDRNAFTYGVDLPILLNTTDVDVKGVGHSSTVLGPDLDSHYIVYHNLNNSGGPNRSFNIERLLFDGAQMTTLAQSENSIAPKLPAYVADGSNLLETSGKLLSSASSEATFSAEFNFKDSATTKVAIDYVDADNYSFVELKLGEKTITLNQVVNGVSTLKGSGTIVKNYDPAVWHSLRVAQRDNKVDVYFDNLQKITNASLTATGGKIGYLTSATIGYTAFSNVGKGLSDVLEVKQAHEIIPASLYSNDPALSSGVSLTPASGKYVNTSLAGLTFEGNKATYLVNFKDDGLYGLQLTYPKEDAGKKIGVRIDDGTVYKVTLPNIDTTDTLIRTRIADFNIVNGINQVRLENVGESVHFQNLSFFKASPNTPLFAHNLMTYLDTGADYKTIWKLHEDGHRATAGTRQLVYLGDTTITDFTLEVDMKFIGSTATSTAGIIFHADNASFSQHDSYTSMQGYYVSLNNNEVRLEKLNYSADRLGTKIGANPSATVLHLKVVVRGGLYTVFVNDVKAIEVSDSLPFTHGRLGFYTNGAEVTYKNLSITA